MPAYGNGQRYLSKNGPERERFSSLIVPKSFGWGWTINFARLFGRH